MYDQGSGHIPWTFPLFHDPPEYRYIIQWTDQQRSGGFIIPRFFKSTDEKKLPVLWYHKVKVVALRTVVLRLLVLVMAECTIQVCTVVR